MDKEKKEHSLSYFHLKLKRQSSLAFFLAPINYSTVISNSSTLNIIIECNDESYKVTPSATLKFALHTSNTSSSNRNPDISQKDSQMASSNQNSLSPIIFITNPLETDHYRVFWLEICLSQQVLLLKLQIKGRITILLIQDPHYLPR